jgi:hypothetical protein
MSQHYKPWTAAHDAQLRTLWADPTQTQIMIAAAMGRGKNAIYERTKFLNLQSRAKEMAALKPRFWTEERDAVLEREFSAGKAFSAIGRIIGCTRNAAIGRAGRLGLTRSAEAWAPNKARPQIHTERLTSSTRQAPPRPKVPPKARLTVVGNNTVIEHPQRPPLVLTRADVWRPLPDSKPRPFWEHRFAECNWPVEVEGEIEGTMRCCLPVEHGGQCSTHRAISRAPKQPRDAKPGQLARSLRRYV